LRRRLPESAAHLLPVVSSHEFGVPAEFGGGYQGTRRQDHHTDRSEVLDDECIHAAHPRSVRKPPHAPQGLVSESPPARDAGVTPGWSGWPGVGSGWRRPTSVLRKQLDSFDDAVVDASDLSTDG